jgi:amino acid adenylation domain-containing protein/non-ribosomal peptide synthase protein (TIGR01720 family)
MLIKNVQNIYTLSPLQEQFWLNDNQPSHEFGQSICQLKCEIRGDLDTAQLTKAWQLAVDQQPVLRTLLVGKNLNIPRQLVVKNLKAVIYQKDLRNLSPQEITTQTDSFIDSEKAEVSCSSVNRPLARLSLCQISDQVYYLILSYHRLILDQHSSYLLLHEIFSNYQNLCLNHEIQSERSPENVYFPNYINWLKQQDKSAAKAFWYDSLQGMTIPTPLTIEKSPENHQNSSLHPELKKNYQHYQLKIPVKIFSDWLEKNNHQISLEVLIQAAWSILLSRYSGETTVIFDVQLPGRTAKLPELESIIGTFENKLPKKVDICPDIYVSSWLHNLQTEHQNLQKYQHHSLPEIRNWSNVDLPLSSTCVRFLDSLPQNLIKPAYHNIHITDIESWEKHDYAISLTAYQQNQELTLEITYNCLQFESTSIHRLLGHLQTLLTGMVAETETCLSQLPLLTLQEQQQLTEWNAHTINYPETQCIHQLITTQAIENPDKVAVVFASQQLTYKELNQRANQLAHYLQDLGVQPDTVVGICLERSLEMIVGILGILKAGGAYVPIDPSYPIDRISFILTDAQIRILLTQEHIESELPTYWGQVICLDSEWEEIAEESTDDPHSNVTANNLVYGIYTSGSTGKPKGVLVTHQNLVHSTSNRSNYYQKPIESFLLLSSFAFDSSVAGIFWTLCQGGTLILPPQDFQAEPLQLTNLIAKHQISYLLSIPSLYAVILEQSTPQQLAGLQTVILAGEPCLGNLIKRHRQLLPNCGLFNEYGPTEGTVWSTVYNCQDWQQEPLVPIGRPIANTQIYILDSHLQLVPIGIKGEIYIGGAGIARGYLHRQELTASKFITHIIQEQPQYLYRTGDLGRYREDGNVEFLGRIDEQVKIRGYRIEIGEIEAILGQHQSVKEIAVITKEIADENGEIGISIRKRLVAYFVSQDSAHPPTVTQLRDFLHKQLPDYMVPATFVALSAMPLTPNGKIDRRNLAKIEDITSPTQTDCTDLLTPEEACLKDIWSELLKLKQVSIHDNFFELGGDSIVSIQMIARANQAGLMINPKHLFENQTIAKLARVAATHSGMTTIAEQGIITGKIPLTPIQHWFWEQNLPAPHHFNQSLLLDVPANLQIELLNQAVQKLIVHHDILRLRCDLSGQHFIHPVDDQVPFTTINVANIPDLQQSITITKLANEIQASLNLVEGPILRVVLFQLGENKTDRLLFVIHHLVVDGISWRILLEDLVTAYEQRYLPPKTTSFLSWAERLLEYAESDSITQEMDYWQQQYKSNIAPVPVDIPNNLDQNLFASSKTLSIYLDIEQTRSLLQEVPTAYNTQINDILLTALALTWEKWTGDREMLIELEAHGREQLWDDIDLSRTVGWFTTRFPVMLRLDPVDINQLGVAIKTIKEKLRSIPAKGLGYGILRYLSPDSNIRGNFKAEICPEISFNYLGQFDSIKSASLILGFASEDTGLTQDPLGKRKHLLELNGLVIADQLRIDWTYSENIHQKHTIENLADNFIAILQSLINHCLNPDVGGYTPSDFPDLELSQSALDDLIAQIN